jgi:hypothetical protein
MTCQKQREVLANDLGWNSAGIHRETSPCQLYVCVVRDSVGTEICGDKMFYVGGSGTQPFEISEKAVK